MPVNLSFHNDMIKVKIYGDKFHEILSVVKDQFYRKFDPDLKAWLVPKEGFNRLRSDLEEVDTVQVDDKVKLYFESERDTSGIMKGTDEEYSKAPIEIEDLNVELYDFQNQAVRFLVDKKRALLADSVGLGKSICAFAAALKMKQNGLINSVLIVGPRSVEEEWDDMIERFTNYKMHRLSKTREYNQDHFFNYITYDMLIRDVKKFKNVPRTNLKRKIYDKKVIKDISRYDLLIIDEAHKCGHNRTQRSKVVRKISTIIPNVFLLSATPLQNRLRELYYVFQIVDKYILGNYMTFADNHFVKGGFQGREIIGYKNLDIVAQRIAPYMLRRTRNEVCKSLPPKTETHRWTDLTKEQRRMYGDVKRKIIEIERDPDKEIRIKEAEILAEIQYLRQVCLSTHLINPDIMSSAKLPLLEELVEDIYNDGNKMIIYCFYKSMCEVIRERLAGYGVVYLSGDTIQNLRELKQEFSRDDRNILLMTKVGGEGLNLEMANFFIFFNPEFNPQVMKQLSGRIDRITQTKPIEIIHLLARDTYEERMTKIINEKLKLFDRVINYRDIMRSSI